MSHRKNATNDSNEASPLRDNLSPKIQAIIRTPGREHFVTGEDIAQPAAGDTQTKKPQPVSSNGKPRPCLFPCGRLAAKGDFLC